MSFEQSYEQANQSLSQSFTQHPVAWIAGLAAAWYFKDYWLPYVTTIWNTIKSYIPKPQPVAAPVVNLISESKGVEPASSQTIVAVTEWEKLRNHAEANGMDETVKKLDDMWPTLNNKPKSK